MANRTNATHHERQVGTPEETIAEQFGRGAATSKACIASAFASGGFDDATASVLIDGTAKFYDAWYRSMSTETPGAIPDAACVVVVPVPVGHSADDVIAAIERADVVLRSACDTIPTKYAYPIRCTAVKTGDPPKVSVVIRCG